MGGTNSMNRLKIWWIFFLCIWGAIILTCIHYRSKISVESIITFTPSSPVLAASAMMLLFALKSLSIVIYCGILYAASGILFPLPAAIALNFCGTAVMVSVPYFIGRKTGADMVNKITKKYPKAEKLRKMRKDNDLFFTLFTRFIGILPCDIVSLYMGAIEVDYGKYLLGCLLGMLPPIVTLPVMGRSITDIKSPKFIIAFCAELLFMISSAFVYRVYKKKHRLDESSIKEK